MRLLNRKGLDMMEEPQEIKHGECGLKDRREVGDEVSAGDKTPIRKSWVFFLRARRGDHTVAVVSAVGEKTGGMKTNGQEVVVTVRWRW